MTENKMPTLETIAQQRKQNSGTQKRLKARINEIIDSWNDKSRRSASGFDKFSAELKTAEKIGYILRNNYRVALAADVLPALVAILNKYAGKKAGEKTMEKMREEFKAATGCGLYLERYTFGQKSETAHIYEMRNGYKMGEEIEMRTTQRAAMIDDDNIIHAIPAESFKPSMLSEFVDNPAARVQEIAEADKRIEELKKAYNEAADARNALIVEGYERINRIY